LNYLDALAGNGARARELIGMASPLLRAPLEYGQGGDFFTGRKFGRKEYAAVGSLIDKLDMPKGVKDWIGYTKEQDAAGRPLYKLDQSKAYFLFEAWATSRIVRTSDRVFKSIVDGGDQGLLQWFLTATKSQKLDLNEEDRKRLDLRKRAIQEELNKRGLSSQKKVEQLVAY
jgi:hypothetical protein